jgi:hypothetical protein
MAWPRFSDQPPSGDPGLGLLRWLSIRPAGNSRWRKAAAALLADGPDFAERLLLGCFRARPPRLRPAGEGAQFAAWLAGPGRQSAGCC